MRTGDTSSNVCFVSGFFFNRRRLINKRAFSFHFLCAWAATPHLLSVSLALSPASVVLE